MIKKSLSSILGLEYKLGAGSNVFFQKKLNCAAKNSKEFHVFFKFGGNFEAQILKIYKIH